MNVIRGVGYIRVSTAEQATRGLSLDAQEAEIRTYAKAHGIELFNIYVDAGITARKRLDRREAFGQMMKDVDAGLIDEIIVMRLDRWFRNIYDYHKMMNEHLIPHGVNWSAVKEDYDTKTTNGRLMINLRLAIAEQECDTDGDRIRDIHDNQIANGIWIGGCAPPGYRIENKRLSIDPDMQPAVSYFFERLLSCGSVRRAMLDMNERHNLHFEYGQAIRMARSTTYCGVRRENYNYCPTYISQDEHAQIMAALEHNVRVRSADNARIHIFSGLLVCACCGRRLAANTVRKKSVTWTAYRCHRAFGDHVCDNRHLVDERKVEAWLLDYLENGLSDYIVSASVADAQPVVVDNTAAIRERQERVKELFINGFIDLQEYKRRAAELEAKIQVPEKQPPRSMEKLKSLLERGVRAIYNDLSRGERQEFWRSIIREIPVNNGAVSGDPNFL